MFGRNSARASSTWRQPGEPKRIMPRNLILKANFHIQFCCLRITYEINIKKINYNSWDKSTNISEGTNLKEEELRQQNGFPTKLCMIQTTITTSDGGDIQKTRKKATLIPDCYGTGTQSTSASCPASTGSSNPTTQPPRMSSTAPPALTTTRATSASKASVFEWAATESWAPRCRRTCAESVEATALNAQFRFPLIYFPHMPSLRCRCAHFGKESTETSAR